MQKKKIIDGKIVVSFILIVFIIIYRYLKLIYIYIYMWSWTTFLKSTFMWWKSSRSRLVADDVINEQISLEAVTQTPDMKYDTGLPTWLLLL